MAGQHRVDPLGSPLGTTLGRGATALATATSDTEVLSDERLLELARAAAGQRRETLLDQLYRRHYATVAGWCLAISRDPADAEELAQEVFLKAHRAIESFRGDSRFSTWLYVITRRTALDRAEGSRRRDGYSVPADGELAALAVAPEALRRCERAQAARELRRAVRDQLEPLEARALLLHYASGLTLPAITQLLDLRNRSGAKALLVSAMRKLRKHFADECAIERDARDQPTRFTPASTRRSRP
jgi:RNA polymerase sigma-70 factor (ECF subfamily)